MLKGTRGRGIILIFFSVVFLTCLARSCFSEEIPVIPEFTSKDRVLILAPHPDDEIIGTGGVLQKALKAGAEVRVVCFTNGDANQLAFIVYEKRFTFRSGEILHMGEVRRKETIAALGSLGVDPKRVFFLGYPDFGTFSILTKYWGDVKPYKSLFTRVSKVSYQEALSVNAPYCGESILKDFDTILSNFKPTKVFVSHPVDTNGDHRALYLFLRLALWDLEGRIGEPQVFPYIIHVVGWPKPRGYHPDLALEPPAKYVGVEWQKAPLTQEEVKRKHDAVKFFKSQIEYNPPYLFTYVRANELFGDYRPIVLKTQAGPEFVWEDLGLTKEEENEPPEARPDPKNKISSLAYGRTENDLWVRITLKKNIDKDFGITIFLLGYNKEKDFSVMPKIRITLGAFGVKVRDKRQPLKAQVRLASKGHRIVLKIPLSVLGDPDRILSSAHAMAFPYESTAWRILELE